MIKHWKYLKYVVRHKFFVLVAGRRVGASWWRLLVHDWSKFLPSEWFPYVNYFYGNLPAWDAAKIQCPGYNWSHTKEGASFAFDGAWLHHQKLNPHHWQYWILREDSGATKLLPMPEKYVRELVADWMGAGRAITGKWEAAAWYHKNRDKIQLQDGTRSLVERLLEDSIT